MSARSSIELNKKRAVILLLRYPLYAALSTGISSFSKWSGIAASGIAVYRLLPNTLLTDAADILRIRTSRRVGCALRGRLSMPPAA
jgi:hypothetical protein